MSTQDKADQAWTDRSGAKWVAMQEQTDAQLAPLGRAVLERLAPAPGERILDVGCGAGQTLLELAALVGRDGRVVGLDISSPMLARARERVAEAGLTQVDLVLGDAATERFAHPFDVVFSRFGVMFFEDPAAAFRSLRAALRSGGRLGFVCWQALERNPWADRPLAAVRAVAPDQPLPPLLAPGRPGPFSFADPEHVRGVLSAAGLAQVSIEPREFVGPIGGARTLDEAVDFVLAIGPTARFIAEAPAALAPALRAAVHAALAPFATAEGVRVPFRALVVSARAP